MGGIGVDLHGHAATGGGAQHPAQVQGQLASGGHEVADGMAEDRDVRILDGGDRADGLRLEIEVVGVAQGRHYVVEGLQQIGVDGQLAPRTRPPPPRRAAG